MKSGALVILLALPMAEMAFAADKSVVMSVETMVCGPDPHNIKNTLASIIGVKAVQISLDDKKVTVTFDDAKENVDGLLSAMAGAGFAALLVGGPH